MFIVFYYILRKLVYNISMLNKFKFKFFLSLVNTFTLGKNQEYDQEEKDILFKNQDDWKKFLKEQDQNGYIVYTNEFLDTLGKMDPDGEAVPIISFIFTGSNCPGCRPFKTTNLIKNLSTETNKVFSNYINIHNKQIGYKILFVLINLDEKENNPELTKFLRGLPTINSIPNVFFICRNKNCKNKTCVKSQKRLTLINNYIGTYFPAEKWIKDLMDDKDEGLLKKIQTHNFKEK